MVRPQTARTPLAATLVAGRGAARRAIGLPGTMRDGAGPCDIAILDISATGFLAELPDGVALEPGTRVRVAATPIGRQPVMVVRREGRRHGFAFVTPLAPRTVAALGPGVSNVEPLFAPAVPGPGRSWPVSLALLATAGGGAWTMLALLLYLTA